MNEKRDRRQRWRFFLENAGYATPPGRAACALELARAEETLEQAEALELGRVRWELDDTPYDPGDAETPEEAARLFDSGEWTGPFGAVLELEGEHLASVWGIVLGPQELADPYARVMAAELASEQLDELRQAIGDELDELEAVGTP
jgi:hypothetical protein